MKFFLRPKSRVFLVAGVLAACAVGLCFAQTRPGGSAPAGIPTAPPGRGYLGIDVAEIDPSRAQALKLSSTHGALITMIDHDAPAGQAGLRVNDVVTQLNGQSIDSADQLRRILHDLAPGHTVNLTILREGVPQTIATALVDRKAMEKAAWNKLDSNPPYPEGMGFLSSSAAPGSAHLSLFAGSFKVGAMLEPLTAQMASYLGIESGIVVKQVDRKSLADKAGLKPFDVILKVGPEPIATAADWDRALRANLGRPVAITILRDRRQLFLTIDLSQNHKQGKLSPPISTAQQPLS